MFLTTLICKDDETGDYLRLFVGFHKENNISHYSYTFMLMDKDNNPNSYYLTKRNEVNKYIPNDIKNKKQIFPIIENMTRKLLNKTLPVEIIRRTAEALEGDSLTRYERVTNIMVNEYGYKVISETKDQFGYIVWELSKTNNTENNKEMDESYNISSMPSYEEIIKKTFNPILALLNN